MRSVIQTAAVFGILALVFLGLFQLERWMRRRKRQGKKLPPALWVCLAALSLFLPGVGPVIGLVLGLVLGLLLVIRLFPAFRRQTKRETDAYLQERRREIAADRADWERRRAQERKRKEEARAEAERLEKQARWWEAEARKTRAPADIRRAGEYRDLANAAWRKL